MFKLDNPFWNAISKICDLVILNFVFAVSCIPLVTIGASVTALYTVLRKMVHDEGGGAAKEFVKAFRAIFKQATILWIILLPIGLVTLYEMYLITLVEIPALQIFRYVFFGLLAVWFMIVSWVFPVQSKFENPVLKTLKNGALMSMYHLLPWTLIIVVVNAAPWALLLSFPNFGFVLIQLLIWIGFVAIAGLNTMIFERLFQQHIDAREE